MVRGAGVGLILSASVAAAQSAGKPSDGAPVASAAGTLVPPDTAATPTSNPTTNAGEAATRAASTTSNPAPAPGNNAGDDTPTETPPSSITQLPADAPTQAGAVPEAPPPLHVVPPGEIPGHLSATALGIRWDFFGELVVNTNYNTSTMVVGSIPGFVQIRSAATTGQFNVSPGNTFLGVSATPPRLGAVQLQAKFDMDFRSNAPYLNENAFLPLVRDLYLEATWSRLHLLAGQAADIISPRSSATLNFYPLSFIPGDIGDYRPQFRVEWHQPMADWMEVTLQAAIAQAVQTFAVSDTVQATQAGIPDFQGHLGLAFGGERDDGPRVFECGVAGHYGRRQVTISAKQYTSWSFVTDASLRLTDSTLIEGEYFIGQLLGDYSGAIFQTIDPTTQVAIRARGGWVQITQRIGSRLTLHAGFGTDDPFDQDLADAERRSNTEVFANAVVRVVAGLKIGLEFSGWWTGWVNRETATAFRTELAIIYGF